MYLSYKDNVREIMKGGVLWYLVYGRKDFRLMWGLNPEPLDQWASTESTELSKCIKI